VIFPAKSHKTSFILAGVFCFGGIAGASFVLFATDTDLFDRTAAYLLLGFIAGVCLFTFPHRYEIKNGRMKIRSGLLVIKNVAIESVTRVYLSKGWPLSHTMYPVSGWRLSTAKSEVLVIPKDEVAFFLEFAAQAPHLRRYGQELRSEPDSPDSLDALNG
jgi:hypothetical protein